MRFLRSNTAVIVTVGPFYDKTDGVTIETALTITNERITLTADTDAGSAPTNILDNVTGATAATANDLNYITGNDAGMMQLELAAADTNRVGRMFLSITDAANHVPVFHEFFVLPQAIYDWLTGVIVPLPANVTTWLGTAAATPTVAGVPEVDLTHVAGATTNVSTLATSVQTIVGVTAAVIADAVLDEDMTAHQAQGSLGQAIGDPVADTNTIYKAVVTDATGATVGVDVVAMKGDTAAILVDTGTTLDGRIPAALVSGKMDSVADVTAISGDSVAADNLEKEYDGTGYGHILQRTTIATLATQTSFTLTAGSADNDAYNGCIILIQDAATAAQKAVAVIGDYTGSTKTVTLLNDPAVFTMATTDIVTIIADRALKATVDNRTLHVSAGGESGVDWANIGSPTTAQNLSGTNIDPDQVVASVSGAGGRGTGAGGSVTGAVGSVTGAVGSVTGAVGSVAAGGITAASIATNAIDADALAADAVTEIQAGLATPTNITAGTITTVTNLTNAPTNGDLTATMKTSITTAVPTAAVNAAAVWDLDATAHQTTGTFGQAIGDPVADTNTIYGAVVTGAAGATVAADIIAVKADTAAILLDTAEIGAAGAGLTNIGTIATVTNLTNLPAAAALEATLTAMKGATFAGATDSLEAIRDRGDAAWITATGFSTHSAADVWASVARTLTAVTNIVLAKGVGVTGFNDI